MLSRLSRETLTRRLFEATPELKEVYVKKDWNFYQEKNEFIVVGDMDVSILQKKLNAIYPIAIVRVAAARDSLVLMNTIMIWSAGRWLYDSQD